MTQDEEHLRLLSIFHYVVGGLAGLSALFPLIAFIMVTTKVSSLRASAPHGEELPFAFTDWFFTLFISVFIVADGVCGVFMIAAGRFLAQRKHYLFCQVMAGIECIFTPHGTVLGVFTLLVLTRDTVKRLFLPGESSDSPGLLQM
ncbi:MAG: hypothetical protein EHM35_15545 [Planctomycetaceae bacterium]|nr:MAG: hypothetical protein EHM35_15545 [Planctomycetaceae bacterium]